MLSNLESYNAEMIRRGKSRQERFELLMEMRNQQLKVLQQANADFNFRKLSGNDPKMIEGCGRWDLTLFGYLEFHLQEKRNETHLLHLHKEI